MKIKNTKLYKDYHKIMEPSQSHKKISKNISEFMNSSYIKQKMKRSSSVGIERVSKMNYRSLTPLDITQKVKPSGHVLYLDMQNIFDRKTLKAKIEHKLNSILQTSVAIKIIPTSGQ
jgi:hypothetical protein